jgi:hypothetical protein
MAASPAFIATPKTPVVSFANADGTAYKNVHAAGAIGSRIDTLFASNSDTSVATVVQLAITKSGVDYVIGEVTIPANAGTNGVVKSVAVLNPTDIPGLAYTENGALYLETGAALRARCKVAVAGVFALQIAGVAGDY